MRRQHMHIPGPGNIPESVFEAIRRHPIDYGGDSFALLLETLKRSLKSIFLAPDHDIVIYPAADSGGLEAAIINTLSAGSRVLAFNQGVHSERFAAIAREYGCEVRLVDVEWGEAVTEGLLYEELTGSFGCRADAILLTHTELSTGVKNNLSMVRGLLDELGHPALVLVDATGSLASSELYTADWGLDVVIGASHMGLMCPGGLTVLAFSPKAMEAGYTSTLPKGYWDARVMLARNSMGQMPYTPAVGLMYGLQEALILLEEEGLEQVWARHKRNAQAIRAAIATMHLELLPHDSANYAESLTCIRLPTGYREDLLIRALADYGVVVSGGLARFQGKLLRVGHSGALHEAEVLALVSLLELSLYGLGLPLRFGDAAAAAQQCLSKN